MDRNRHHQFNKNTFNHENPWRNSHPIGQFQLGNRYFPYDDRNNSFSNKKKMEKFYNKKCTFMSYNNVSYQQNTESGPRKHGCYSFENSCQPNTNKRGSCFPQELNNGKRESNPTNRNINLNNENIPVHPVSSNEASFQTNVKWPETKNIEDHILSVSKSDVLVKPMLKSVTSTSSNSGKLLNPISKTYNKSHGPIVIKSKTPKINVPATKRILSSSVSSRDTISFSNAKLKEWSKGLQKACPNMSSCDTEIINHLVKLPCSHKDKVALKFILKEHSKSKKKLSYPRFNLLPSDSRNSLNINYESMEKAVSDAMNVLPDNVLNSLVCALESDKEDHCDKTLSNNQSEVFASSSSQSEFCNTLSKNKKRHKNNSSALNTKQKKTKRPSMNMVNNSRKGKSKAINHPDKNPSSMLLSKRSQNSADVNDKSSVETNQSEIHLKQEVVYEESDPAFPNEELNVANLIDLFAQGTVKLKSEFDDPVIDAMQTFGSSVWDQVSSPAGQVDPKVSSSAASSSLPKPGNTAKEATVLPSKDKDSTPNANDVIENTKTADDTAANRSDSSVFHTNVTLLMEINNQEEALHKELQNAEQEICRLQELLNACKNKKNELQKKEIALRTKRQLILHQLQGAVVDEHEKKIHSENTPSKHPQPHNNIVPTNHDAHSNKSPSSALNDGKANEITIIPSVVTVNVPVINIEDSAEEDNCEIEKSFNKNRQNNVWSANQKGLENKTDVCVNIQQLQAHDTAVSFIQIFEDYMYTACNASLKKISLANPSEVVEFKGHTKRVSGLYVIRRSETVHLYTSCIDGFFRCFNALLGCLLFKVDIKCSIFCMCRGETWAKTFLGLQNGFVACLKGNQILKSFKGSSSSISRLVTASQGALHVLCVISLDGFVTIWDTSSLLILRCLEGRVKLPSYTQIFDNSIYISSSDKSLLIQDISSGKLQKIVNLPTSSTGLAVYNNYIFSSSYDGIVRCYDMKKEFILHSMYYGADKECVTCMASCKDWIFTGNRKGLVGAVRFKKNGLVTCEFGRCHFKFGSKSDLLHHVTVDHVTNMDNRRDCCPWRKCTFDFAASSTIKSRENHILKHLS